VTTGRRRARAAGARNPVITADRAEPTGALTTAFVDAHFHVWNLKAHDQPWLAEPEHGPIHRDFAIEDLEPTARAADITAAVLVQTIAAREETSEFLALAGRHELIAGVVGWVDLTAPDVADRLAALREGPHGRYLKAIRHPVQGEPDPRWLCRADVRRGLAAVAAAGLAYDLLVVPEQLPAAAETAAAIPHLRFVLDHLGKPPIASRPPGPWARALRDLATNPNVNAKLSGLLTQAPPQSRSVAGLRPHVDVALDAFGTDRLMAGSDWPVCLLAASYAQTVRTTRALVAELSNGERAAILGDTARRVYRLLP